LARRGIKGFLLGVVRFHSLLIKYGYVLNFKAMIAWSVDISNESILRPEN
jgi:hypothetical protein